MSGIKNWLWNGSLCFLADDSRSGIQMAKFIEVIIPEYDKSVKALINIDRILKVVPYNNGNESQIFWEVAEEKKQFCEVVSIPYADLIQQLLDK